ncbi:hypothetical protein SALWKB2_1547 [Snodgrassella alvi wkB2]|nr:hypothetical protein SALWKB2_1547 [Snodgrassella alvi wkB2]
METTGRVCGKILFLHGKINRIPVKNIAGSGGLVKVQSD